MEEVTRVREFCSTHGTIYWERTVVGMIMICLALRDVDWSVPHHPHGLPAHLHGDGGDGAGGEDG